MEGMRTGAVGCVLLVSSYSMAENPFIVFAIAASLPSGLSAQQQNAWLDKGVGNDAIARLAGPRGLRAFPAGKTGSQMGAWFKRKLGSLGHQQDRKMRIPNWGVKVMAQVGVNEQVLAGREIYLVFDRGAINTAEWTGSYDGSKLGLNRAAHSGRADGGHSERCRFLNFPGQVPALRQPCKTALSLGGITQEEAIHQFKPHHLAKG
jgi:TRAP-type mannitol/chloroaromatic compound transport system substrate-binding protein